MLRGTAAPCTHLPGLAAGVRVPRRILQQKNLKGAEAFCNIQHTNRVAHTTMSVIYCKECVRLGLVTLTVQVELYSM